MFLFNDKKMRRGGWVGEMKKLPFQGKNRRQFIAAQSHAATHLMQGITLYLLLGPAGMGGQWVHEPKNSNIEARISKQIQISNDQNSKRCSRNKIVSVIGKFGFRDCFGFRVSNFGFNQ
jgi:hypothetical protein